MEPESLQTVNELTASSFQNSLTGGLPSSYQNSLPGSGVAGSSQNPMPGGDLACGEVAGFSGNYSESGSNTII